MENMHDQLDLFSKDEEFRPNPRVNEKKYLLISLKPQYYDQIKIGAKKYEYRRKFITEKCTCFVYVNAPVSLVSGVLELDRPIFSTIEKISEIADNQRLGNGVSIKKYMSGLQKGFAIPILSFREFLPMSKDEIKQIHHKFSPPQSYIILNNYPDLLKALMDRSNSTEFKK